jgi:hypothetical protein
VRRFKARWGYFEFRDGYLDETKRNRKRCPTASCDANGVMMGIADHKGEKIYWHCFVCGKDDPVHQADRAA